MLEIDHKDYPTALVAGSVRMEILSSGDSKSLSSNEKRDSAALWLHTLSGAWCLSSRKCTKDSDNRRIQSWFSRAVLESVLGSGFHFCCLQNQWLVFAVVFTLVFATCSRTFNSLCQCTRTMMVTSAVTTVAQVYFHPLTSTSTSRPPPSRVDHHRMHAWR